MSTIRPVAGLDVSKASSEFCLLAPDNTVLATLHILNDSPDDIDKAVSLLRKSEKDFGCSPIVVMESTGHYHKTLFHALAQREIDVVIVNPLQSDSIKNLDVRKVKNDRWDAKRLALLYRIKGDSLRTSSWSDDATSALKDLVRQYYSIQDELTAHHQRLTALLDQVLFGYEENFYSLSTKTGMTVLKKFPSAKAILKTRSSTLVTLIAKTSRQGEKHARAKYEALLKIAQIMLKLGNPAEHLAMIIQTEITLIENVQLVQTSVEQAMKTLVEQDRQGSTPTLSKNVELLDSIPGIGFLTAVTILAELGNVKVFKSAQALTAYCGLDPRVLQSGTFKGTRNKISKRGSSLLRRVLFSVACNNIHNTNKQPLNPYLLNFYQQKCQSKPKMVALVAVMHKLVFIIFAVLRDQKPFELRDPKEHAAQLAA